MKKSVLLLMTVLSLAAVSIALPQTVHAQTMTAFAIGGDTTPDPNITYSGGVSGILNINVPKGFIISKVGLGASTHARIEFTPLTAIGAAGFSYNAATGGYSQILKGGAFKITDTVSGTVLVAGQFGEAVLHGTNGSCSMALTLQKNSAVYGATPLFPKGWSREGGSFAVEFNSLFPAKVNTTASTVGLPGGIGDFKANDGMTFAAKKP